MREDKRAVASGQDGSLSDFLSGGPARARGELICQSELKEHLLSLLSGKKESDGFSASRRVIASFSHTQAPAYTKLLNVGSPSDPNNFLGVPLNDGPILFLVIILDKAVPVR